VRIQPDNPACHLKLADALLDARQEQQALRHLRKALRLHPRDVETLLKLGIVLAQQKEPRAAPSLIRRQ
jgi:Flp pilus assembly protein TadD